MQAEALLKRHLPGFEMINIEEVAAREGVDVDAGMGMQSPFQFAPSRPFSMRPGDPPGMPPKGFPYPPPQHMLPPGYPMPPMYGGPPGAPFPPPMGMHGPPPPHYNPHLHPSFQHMGPPPPPPIQRPTSASGELKGTDPQLNDLSNSQVCYLRVYDLSALTPLISHLQRDSGCLLPSSTA